MSGWAVAAAGAGLAAILVGCWLDRRPLSWFYSRRAFERPVVLRPTPLDQHERVPVELVRLPEEAVWNMGELGGRRDESS